VICTGYLVEERATTRKLGIAAFAHLEIELQTNSSVIHAGVNRRGFREDSIVIQDAGWASARQDEPNL